MKVSSKVQRYLTENHKLNNISYVKAFGDSKIPYAGIYMAETEEKKPWILYLNSSGRPVAYYDISEESLAKKGQSREESVIEFSCWAADQFASNPCKDKVKIDWNRLDEIAYRIRRDAGVTTDAIDIEAFVKSMGGEIIEDLSWYDDAFMYKAGENAFKIKIKKRNGSTEYDKGARIWAIAQHFAYIVLICGYGDYVDDVNSWDVVPAGEWLNWKGFNLDPIYVNYLAAAILMPVREFSAAVERATDRNTRKINVQHLAECFDVSMREIDYRGRCLGMWYL